MVSEPERSVASTTTTTCASAAINRLRATNAQRWMPKPGGSSDTTAPAARTAECSWRLEAGYGRSAPPASTATGAAVPSSDPAWAAESTPRASPETTPTPAADSPRPRSRATVCPYGVDRRAPTIATASSTPTHPGSPATCSTAGGSGRSRSRPG